MHVDVGIVLFRQVEAVFDVGQTVIRGVLVGRHAADNVTAHAHGFIHQLVAARILDDAFLGEGHQLEGHPILVFLPQGQNAAQGLLAADRVDIDVGSHGQGSVDQSLVQYSSRAQDDVFIRVLLFSIPDDLNGFCQGTADIFANTVQNVDLVQVDVRVDQGRDQKFTLQVDDCFRLAVGILTDPADQLVFAIDIPQTFTLPERAVFQQE